MLRSISKKFQFAVEKFLPDAFVFAIVLTLVTFIMGIAITKEMPFQMIQYWYEGFWDFLAFTSQMILILITGYCLVEAPAIKKGLDYLASLPQTPVAALTLTIVVSAIAGYISWGLGFVLGALFSIAVARNLPQMDFRILVAGAYAGTVVVLPVGLTVTAPLLVNTPGHNLEQAIGLIPLSQTILSPMLLGTSLVTLLVIVFVFRAMIPETRDVVPLKENDDNRVRNETASSTVENTLASRLETSVILSYSIVLMGFIYIVSYFVANGFNLELNILNFIFLTLGLALHRTPKSYISAITRAMPSAAGIAIQFPFYAGIMGMMAGSGLISVIAQWFVSISTPFTFPLFSMLSASIVNIFVPSAGGQWMIQGPIMVEATEMLGLPAALAVNTITLGDQITNLLQPFFALIALGISGLSLRDIWGFCLVAMIVFFVIAALGVTFLPLSF